jgi:hypothetical protein
VLRGLLGLLRGDRAGARAALTSATDTLGRLGQRGGEHAAAGFLGLLCRQEGKLAEAHSLLTQAMRTPDAALCALFALHCAAIDTDVGELEPARRALDELAALPLVARDPELSAALDVERARLSSDASAALGRARSMSDQSLRLRLSLACSEAAITVRPSAPLPAPSALVVARSGQWFRAPHGERTSLDRRRPLALLLRRLAAERSETPGRALGWDTLLEAGWPGERVLAEAGAHRVRVAISTLRKLGLRDLLLTEPDGYLLRPDLQIALVD